MTMAAGPPRQIEVLRPLSYKVAFVMCMYRSGGGEADEVVGLIFIERPQQVYVVRMLDNDHRWEHLGSDCCRFKLCLSDSYRRRPALHDPHYPGMETDPRSIHHVLYRFDRS